MKKLSLGLTALLATTATVLAHGDHAHVPGSNLTHAAQGPNTLTLVVVGGLAVVGIVTALLHRFGR